LITTQARKELESQADEVFGVTRLVATLRSRMQAKMPEELSEAEFVTLDLLVHQGTMIVGDLQRAVGILPAQMSRLLRGLGEKGGAPFVTSSINSQDRRKVDIQITDAGRAAYERYRTARRTTALEFLEQMGPEDRNNFMRMLRSFRESIDKRMQNK